ncbi:MAG: hypothetical protein IJP78_00250 [Clostridia bacterium]|nr:hypothetical protein [Clostridia bacterium]
MKIIIIGDCEYFVTRLDLSMDSFADLQNGSQMEETEQKDILAKYIFNAIDEKNTQKPSIEFVAVHIDEIIEKNIDAILQDNDYLKAFYNQISESEAVRKRFLQSIDLYWENCIEEIKEPLSAFVSACSSAFYFSQDKMDSIKNSLTSIFNVASELYSEYEIKLSETLKKFEELIHHYDPNAHDDDFIAWANWGWSVIGSAPVSFHLSVPKTKERADSLAMEFFRTNEQINAMFDETKKYDNCKLTDYQEAIDNFKTENYKSCALMLFSLIDGLLINIMVTDKRGPGMKSIDNFDKLLQEKDEIVKGFASRHWYISAIACLKEVYKRLNHFTVEPSIINRHEIVHGMGKWQVTNKDCIQLFLLYCNILYLIKRIDSSTPKAS